MEVTEHIDWLARIEFFNRWLELTEGLPQGYHVHPVRYVCANELSLSPSA
jgi:hypothetical protein